MQRGPLCGRCGTTLGWESIRFTESMGSVECPTCRLAPPAFARAVAFAEYDSEVREMLHLLKFEHERAVAGPMLGARLAQAIATLLDGTARELLVVPVPLFRTREAERGFNQAEVLARSAVMALRTTHPAWKLKLRADVLRRAKATPSLYDLTPSQRRSALQGAFSVANAAAIQGREVLLIDDIMTTGSTAHACASALRRAGATRVRVATVARAQPERFTHRAHAPEAGNDARADVSLWGAEDGNF
jgi:ComF family protein